MLLLSILGIIGLKLLRCCSGQDSFFWFLIKAVLVIFSLF